MREVGEAMKVQVKEVNEGWGAKKGQTRLNEVAVTTFKLSPLLLYFSILFRSLSKRPTHGRSPCLAATLSIAQGESSLYSGG
jgi:hypothetical protein